MALRCALQRLRYAPHPTPPHPALHTLTPPTRKAPAPAPAPCRRHPVLDALMEGAFVPNHTHLSGDAACCQVVTG